MYPERIPYLIDIPQIALGDLFVQAAARYGDRPALSFGGRLWTYRALCDDAKAFAAALGDAGVAYGDRVAVMLPNCPAFVIAYYGTLLAGGTVALFNPMSVEREVAELLADAEPKVVVTLASLLPRVAASQPSQPKFAVLVQDGQTADGAGASDLDAAHSSGSPEAPFGTIEFNMFLHRGQTRTFEPVAIQPTSDVATLQYTGGTTGKPKAAMLTHFNLVANVMQSATFYQDLYRPGEDVCLAVLPLFHAFGMTLCMNVSLYLGAKLVLLPKFEPQLVIRALREERPTIFPGVPTMYTALLHMPDISAEDLGSIRMCISGGGPMPVEVMRAFEAKAGCTVLEGYGLSETSPITHCNPPFAPRKEGTVGIAFPSTVCRLVSLDGSTDEVAPGGVGELAVKGPQVMKGYWRAPEATREVLHDGWFRTGDVARIDEDGYVSILDRKKDLIIASGYNVYPREIEDVLYGHPLIQEALVVGVPDAYRGETVKACIVLKAGARLTDLELIDYCRSRLAPYKVPRIVEFRMELPKSAIGKLLRRALREEESTE